MPSQKKINAQQSRDRRAKLTLAVLGVVLLAVVGFEVPSMLGGKKPSSAASAPTSASTTTGGTTTAGTPAVAAATATPASYQVVAAAQPGQLTQFSRLHAKNPFHALVSQPAGGSSGGATTTKPASTTPAPSVPFSIPPATPVKPTVPAGPMVLAAVLKLNGIRRVIDVGSSFPIAGPVFKLVAVGKGAIWISLVGGSFASGDQTLKIQLKHPIKLVNTTAGVNYLIRFVRMITVHQALQPLTTTTTTSSAPPTSTATTTTAPTTTTTP